jgi:hypothetical protein
MDDIEQLSQMLDFPMPDKLKHVRPELPKPAFFPAGTGIIYHGKSQRSLPKEGVMCLAHNFGTVKYYNSLKKRGGESLKTYTWGHLLPFLKDCKIPTETCFFTNALMGVMEAKSNLETVGGHEGEEFRKGCLAVFHASLSLQRPSLVLALGKPSMGTYVPAFIAGGLLCLAAAASFILVQRPKLPPPIAAVA